MRSVQTISFKKRHLPHWMVLDKSYFVTIRLKGSLPKKVAEELRKELQQGLADCKSNDDKARLHSIHFKRIEEILHTTKQGPKFLNIAPVADIVFEGLDWLEAERGWLIFAATIMSNHVHVLLRNTKERNGKLNCDLGVFKGFTAKKANEYLERTGKTFWLSENFNHWCRDEGDFRKAVRYIAMNPVQANLRDHWHEWPWTRIKQDCRRYLAE